MPNWLSLAIDAAQRLPIEKIFVRRRNEEERLSELKEIVKKDREIKQSSQVVSKPVSHPGFLGKEADTEARPKVHLSTPEKSQVTEEQTVQYQNREIGKLLLRMERHLAQKMRINGIPCDCGAPKHFLDMEAMTEETIPMVDEPAIYYKILDWIKTVAPKTTLEAVKSGKYESDYPKHSTEARDLRKELLRTLDASALFPNRESKEVPEATPKLQERVDETGINEPAK